jgi:hypothetical protein
MRVLVRLTALVFGLALALGPATARGEVRPGIDFGPSVVWTAYDEKLPVWTTGDRIDFSGGVTGEVGLGPRFGLVSGLRYSGLGNHIDVEFPEGTGEAEIHQRYLVVPVWLRYDFPSLGGLFLQAGPEVGYLLSARVTSEAPMPGGAVLETDDSVTDDMKRSNVSLSGGVGVRRSLGERSLEFVLRYSRGMTDVAEDEEWFSNWKTREIHVGLGLR